MKLSMSIFNEIVIISNILYIVIGNENCEIEGILIKVDIAA